MNDVNLSTLDLNLLVVVDAVLEERSATLAGARLHITQSAVSSSLRRARAVFGDPLVVRNGRGFALTPRAEALVPRLRSVLEDVRTIFGSDASMGPLTTRCFTIACTDAAACVVLPKLLPRFTARLPHATLRTITLDRLFATGLERADVDLLIGIPPRVPPGCDAEVLFEDPMVVIARADHPAIGRRLRLDTYAELPHVELALFDEPDDRVDRALAARDLRRRIEVIVPHINTLPFLVAGSDRIATVMLSVARSFAEPFGLRVLEPPLGLAPLVVKQIWHRRRAEDPGGRVLRELVRSVTARGKRRG